MSDLQRIKVICREERLYSKHTNQFTDGPYYPERLLLTQNNRLKNIRQSRKHYGPTDYLTELFKSYNKFIT